MFEVLDDRSLLEVSGSDSFKFLQNLITNDLASSDYLYSYMLTNQGKYLFDFFVFKISDEKFLIDINKNQLSLFTTKLVMYKLRSNVVFIDLSDTHKVVYSKNIIDFPSLISRQDPRFSGLGTRSIIVKNGFKTTKENLYLDDKYNFAIIDGYTDLIYEKSIPIEYGAEELHAISYTKGCYIGQELISRTKYLGVVRKKIFHLYSDQELSHLSKNDEIIVDNVNIGIICSSYKNKAIALIREERYSQLENKEINIGGSLAKLSVAAFRAK